MYEQTWLRYTRTGGRLVRNTTALRIFLKIKLITARPSKFLTIIKHNSTYLNRRGYDEKYELV